jgi:formate/nitrite transporter FocA (FNT family)
MRRSNPLALFVAAAIAAVLMAVASMGDVAVKKSHNRAHEARTQLMIKSR